MDCGGFVKPTKELAVIMNELNQKINYTNDIRVHLLTLDGKQKFSGEPLPNGYYIIPVYDKGSFLIRVEGPDGWTFRPQQITVSIGGTSSCGQDFELTGFSVTGNVSGAPECKSYGKQPHKAPKGIKVTITSPDGKRAPQSVTSSDHGTYTFENVFPGKYFLEASHSTWIIPQKKIEVEKQWGNVQIKKQFLVSGYDITGQVLETSDKGEPVKGVSFLLYSEGNSGHLIDCPKLAAVLPDRKSQPLCSVFSDVNGRFSFGNIPCGEYILVPFYKSSSTNYDVVPKETKIIIDQDSYRIPTPFLVKGFSVHGRVVGSSGDGIDGVTVKANSSTGESRQTITEANGEYVLDQIISGTYTLQAEKPHYFFAKIDNLKISPSEADLPELVARRYHVCGKISIPQPPSGQRFDGRTKVTMINKEKPSERVLETHTDPTGVYCFEALSGHYTVIPEIPQSEIDAGLLLTDGEIEVTVESAPVLEINFEQARETVAGRVICIESPCDTSISVSLSAVGRNFTETTGLAIGHAASGEEYFIFTGVLPGKYEVTINREHWCWQKEIESIEVTTKYQSDITFVQTGYLFTVNTTNDVNLLYHEAGKEQEDNNVFHLKKGSNPLCLKKSGVYHFTPKSCYKFDQDSYKFDIARNHGVQLSVKFYSVIGTLSVQSTRDDEINVEVMVGEEKETTVPVTLISKPSNGENKTYTFTHWAEKGAKMTLKPVSPTLFFYPSSLQISVEKDECFPPLPKLYGRPGMFLHGSVRPPFANIFIKVLYTSNYQPAIPHVLTDKNGEFHAGPLYDDKEYVIKAEKEGYLIREEEGKSGHFLAQKLGSVEVVVANETGAPIQGVLLSLSGGEGYRNNSATDSSGKFFFRSLFPGQYYLRPLLKEFVFTPSSNTITINEGDDLTLQLTAKRTSYSLFGKVTSLNGEPERGISVDATSSDGLFEDTQTEANGAFRLRGLIPQKTYKVKVQIEKGKSALLRAQPAEVEVTVGTEDIDGVNFIAFRPSDKHEITGIVSTSDQFLPTITVLLTDTTPLNSLIDLVQLGPNNFFAFDGLDGDKEYQVKLRSSLSERQYSYKLSDTKIGPLSKSDKNSHFLNFSFSAVPVSQKVVEVEPGSFATLLITILVGVCIYFYKSINEFLQSNIFDKLQRVENNNNNGKKK